MSLQIIKVGACIQLDCGGGNGNIMLNVIIMIYIRLMRSALPLSRIVLLLINGELLSNIGDKKLLKLYQSETQSIANILEDTIKWGGPHFALFDRR